MGHRVLIISPHFPPINAPDHQRVRMALPYFEQFGWQPHVLAVNPNHVESVQDPLLSQTVPSHIPVTFVDALSAQWTRHLGMRSLGLRCYLSLRKVGDRLLQQKSFDLVYFSTTAFIVMALGAHWRRRYGVPYVLDFQDPWRSDFYQQPGAPPPPGGLLKYEFSQLQAKLAEPKALASASHVTSVSPAYPQTLQKRYPFLSENQFTVLPFGAPEIDFEQLPSLDVKQTVFDPNDGDRHWVYVGRGGKDMDIAARALFLAIQSDRLENPEFWQKTRLHFVGTSYAPKEVAVKTIEPIAQELGIHDLVTEYPHRIPYFEALKVLTDSDVIVILGSKDSSYTASKLYPCILAKKPILAIFHQQSSVVDILNQCQAGRAITFDSTSQPSDIASDIINAFTDLQTNWRDRETEINWSAFEQYTAYSMTQRLCNIFSRSLSHHDSI